MNQLRPILASILLINFFTFAQESANEDVEEVFALWKTHHHANVILAALNALGLDAIKGVAHLTTQIVQRQA